MVMPSPTWQATASARELPHPLHLAVLRFYFSFEPLSGVVGWPSTHGARMQALQRLSREGGSHRRSGGRGPPRSQRSPTGDLYQPLDPGTAVSGFCDEGCSGGSRRRSRFRCCKTQGKAFNIMVGMVIFANAILIGIETDTGLFGGDSRQWVGLDSDLHSLGADAAQRHKLETDLRDGVYADIRIKSGLERNMNRTLKRGGIPLQDYHLLNSGAYTAWEYLFLAFFIVEIFLRVCDIGCRSYCADSWRFLDISIVLLGILDLGVPFFVGQNPSSTTLVALSMLRMARVLRIARLFRLCPELKVIGGAYGKAFSAVLWVGMLILILDFIIAVLLTSIIGAKAQLWEDKAEEIELMFGSLGRSMQTLFALMTLSGWDHVAQILEEVLPATIIVPCIVLYVVLCSFTTVSLINGVICDSFVASQRDGERRGVQRTERHRAGFVKALTNALSSCQQNRNGYLSRDGFKMALEAHPIVITRLRSLDVHTSVDELLQLFDRLCQDSASDVAVEIDSLVEAIALLSGNAKASEVFDLKYLVLAMRRETAERSTQIQYEVTQRHDEQAAVLNSTTAKVTKVQQEVTAMKQDVASVRQELASLRDELQKAHRRAQQEEREHRAALTAMSEKVDVLEVRLAEQGSLHEKVDALSAKIAEQANPEPLVSKFAAEFAAQVAAQLAVQMGGEDAKEKGRLPDACAAAGSTQAEAPIEKNVHCSESSNALPMVESSAAPGIAPHGDKFEELITTLHAEPEPDWTEPEPDWAGNGAKPST